MNQKEKKNATKISKQSNNNNNKIGTIFKSSIDQWLGCFKFFGVSCDVQGEQIYERLNDDERDSINLLKNCVNYAV